MARSTHIYIIREFEGKAMLAVFTVKREAIEWAIRNGWSPHNADLSRMRDGVGDKREVEIRWSM